MAQKSTLAASGTTPVLPTFNSEDDYNSYTAKQDKTLGRLVVSTGAVRFISNLGHNILWSLRYEELERIEKVDRVVTKNIPGKLQSDPGQDLRFVSRAGTEYLLGQIHKRDQAFSQIIGFSNITWQVVW